MILARTERLPYMLPGGRIMRIEDLYTRLDIPVEVIHCINQTENDLTAEELRYFAETLTNPYMYQEGEQILCQRIKPDDNGYKILSVMLQAACVSHEKYIDRGISEEVFTDTMKCFTRFLCEDKEWQGRYKFTRSFWAGRQLSLQLFRMGQLEYELCETEEDKKISIHIPSKADISEAAIEDSFRQSKKFFKRHFPEYAEVDYILTSWLLSPYLKEILPSTSKLINFQKYFNIYEVTENESYKLWVFGNASAKAEDFCEHTSLQKGIKAYALAGGRIGEGSGVLCNI